MKEIKDVKAFNEVISQDKPVLLDFYADWCGPCQVLLPTVEKLSKEYDGQVDILKVNVDSQRELAAKFQVRSIPSIFFMKGNNVVNSVKGVVSEGELRKRVEALV